MRLEKARPSSPQRLKGGEPSHPVGAGDQPFPLFNGWEWVRFGVLARFSAGRTPSRHDLTFWNTGEYPWVSIADMHDGGIVVSTKETVSKKAKDQLFRSAPSP
jgi:type I restriction enzyme S subunit